MNFLSQFLQSVAFWKQVARPTSRRRGRVTTAKSHYKTVLKLNNIWAAEQHENKKIRSDANAEFEKGTKVQETNCLEFLITGNTILASRVYGKLH